MAITHADAKTSGQRGYATEWNKNHVIGDVDRPKNDTTLIVAASNSLDKIRADYVCDGVADQDEINQAMNDLPAFGGEVKLLEGTFQTTAAIVVPKDNVTLDGNGKATKIQTGNNINIISSATRTGLVIKDMWLSGAGVGNPANHGILITGASETLINNCWFDNMGNSGISIGSAFPSPVKVIISNNYFETCLFAGVLLASVHHAIISLNTFDTCRYGMVISRADNTIISNNVITNSTDDGLTIVEGDESIITSNQVMDGAGKGIVISAPIGIQCDDNLVAANIARDNVGADMEVSHALCNDNRIINNSFSQAIVDNGTNTVTAHNKVA